jgi:hypothetical protein
MSNKEEGKEVKLSAKQKETLNLMQNGGVLHWIGGISPYCFMSDNRFTFKISTATCLKLESLGLIEKEQKDGGNTKLKLTESGKKIKL